MVQSRAATVAEYLAELPPERRQVVSTVRDAILAKLPKGYVETMNWGMICYEIPLAVYPETYNGQPLAVVALAAQKNHFSLYLNCMYCDSTQTAALREAFAKEKKKLDMGKSCVRFRRAEDIPLAAIARLIAKIPPKKFIAHYEASRRK